MPIKKKTLKTLFTTTLIFFHSTLQASPAIVTMGIQFASSYIKQRQNAEARKNLIKAESEKILSLQTSLNELRESIHEKIDEASVADTLKKSDGLALNYVLNFSDIAINTTVTKQMQRDLASCIGEIRSALNKWPNYSDILAPMAYDLLSKYITLESILIGNGMRSADEDEEYSKLHNIIKLGIDINEFINQKHREFLFSSCNHTDKELLSCFAMKDSEQRILRKVCAKKIRQYREKRQECADNNIVWHCDKHILHSEKFNQLKAAWGRAIYISKVNTQKLMKMYSGITIKSKSNNEIFLVVKGEKWPVDDSSYKSIFGISEPEVYTYSVDNIKKVNSGVKKIDHSSRILKSTESNDCYLIYGKYKSLINHECLIFSHFDSSKIEEVDKQELDQYITLKPAIEQSST